jgi:hypothetical protein
MQFSSSRFGRILSSVAIATVLTAGMTTAPASAADPPPFFLNDGNPINGIEGHVVSGDTAIAPLNSFAAFAFFFGSGTVITIDWGDGSITGGEGAFYLKSNGEFDHGAVHGSHTYTEEGVYHIFSTVTVPSQNGDPPLIASADDTATITDAPIHVTASSSGLDNGRAPGEATGTPGTPATGGVASFTDDNPFGMFSDFTATIDWGDGNTSSGAIAGPAGPSPGPWQVTGSHQYECPGRYNVRVIVRDDGGSTHDAITTATVAPPTNVLDMVINLLHCA